MNKLNVCRSATVLCGLLGVIMYSRPDMAPGHKDQLIGAALGLISAIFATQWIEYQKRQDEIGSQSSWPGWLRRLLFSGVLGLAFLTASAQTRIKDIRPGAGSSMPEQLTNINGVLYFVADDGVHGKELWKSDGTDQGTVLVKDIIPGVANGEVKNLTNVNGTLFFSAKLTTNSFGVYPNELWKSDGTAAGTVELLDGQINKAESKNPENLMNLDGTLYYTNTLSLGGNGYTGFFKSDGTNSPGTKRIYYYPSEPPVYPKISQLTGLNGLVYFMYGGGLYKSDGINVNTKLVKTITPALEDTKIQRLTNVNGKLFFSADDGQSGNARRLWRSDGTAAGTVKLKDGLTNIGTNIAETPNSENLTDVNGTLYYTSAIFKDGYTYWGLFKSNGSDYPGTSCFGSFIFSMYHAPLPNNIPYNSSGLNTGSPSVLINVNGTLYFVFAGNLWKSNGTAAGTVMVTNAVSPNYLTNVNGTLYFVSGQNSIYKTDPASNTATSVVVSSDVTYNLTNVNGTLFYNHNDPLTGIELYKLDQVPANARARQAANQTGLDVNLQATAYPNPVEDIVTVAIEGAIGQEVRLRLVNLQGRTLLERQINVDEAIHRESMRLDAPGMYLLRVSTLTESKTLKLLKH